MNFSFRAASSLCAAALLVFTATADLSAASVLSEDAAGKTAADLSAAARAAAKGDGLLEALLTELDRSRSLKMDGVAAPYYVEYRVNDVDEMTAEAAFGAMREAQRIHIRILRVVVRIGDYKQDSYYGQGQGQATILPLDNDPIALRHQIWIATDQAYKSAGEALTEKQAALKQFSADEHPVDDFAKAPVVISMEPTVALSVDEPAWKKTLEEVTALYRDYPEVQAVTAAARFSAINDYLVNSEGTVTRSGRATYTVQLNSSTQAADGMRLSRNPGWMVARAAELPSREKLLAESKAMLDTLKALREAPIVEEEYRGPVLFAPDAANDVVASLIGTNVLGRKPQLGKPNRTVGAFATSFRSRILPPFVSVIDDPSLKEFAGKSLVGGYDVDSEGVKAQTVTIVDAGSLNNYLLGRQPIRDFTASNGHGRAAPGALPSPALGILMLKSSESQSPEALKKRLAQMAADQDKPYAYRVETLGPGNSPRLLYRVYAKGGHEELVRGAVFNELDIRALRSDLLAVGNDPLVSNRAGGVPSTVISPSLLFGELTVKRADTSKDKLPDYPAPPIMK